MRKRVRRRYASERRFRMLGFTAVSVSVLFLVFILYTMGAKGLGGFTHYEAPLPIDFTKSDLFLDPATRRGPDAQQTVASADLEGVISKAATAAYGHGAEEMFGNAAVDTLTRAIIDDPDMLNGSTALWLPVASNVDVAAKGDADAKTEQLVRELQSKHSIRRAFNVRFLTSSDSTDPSSVGVWGALKGSFLTVLVTMLLAFPVGVLAAVYLEEFARRNRWTDAIEVSINNLAAVPSIIFGLLGLAVFLNVMNQPRSAHLVG
jgi:phosphate transport system permease protein